METTNTWQKYLYPADEEGDEEEIISIPEMEYEEPAALKEVDQWRSYQAQPQLFFKSGKSFTLTIWEREQHIVKAFARKGAVDQIQHAFMMRFAYKKSFLYVEPLLDNVEGKLLSWHVNNLYDAYNFLILWVEASCNNDKPPNLDVFFNECQKAGAIRSKAKVPMPERSLVTKARDLGESKRCRIDPLRNGGKRGKQLK
jgi:hypothetical protein